MHHKYFPLLSAALICASLIGTAAAQDLTPEQTPKPVLDNFNKMHPDAKDVTSESVTHFNAQLIKIAYKQGEEPEIAYFRPNGSFFVNGFDVNEDEIPLEVQQNLKKEYPDYRVKSAALIVNPNGAGREYEIDMSATGSEWEIIADEGGAILNKTQK